jgi:hypothetical protein
MVRNGFLFMTQPYLRWNTLGTASFFIELAPHKHESFSSIQVSRAAIGCRDGGELWVASLPQSAPADKLKTV